MYVYFLRSTKHTHCIVPVCGLQKKIKRTKATATAPAAASESKGGGTGRKERKEQNKMLLSSQIHHYHVLLT